MGEPSGVGNHEEMVSKLVDDAQTLLRDYLSVWQRYESLSVDTGHAVLEPVTDALALLAGLCDARATFAAPSMN